MCCIVVDDISSWSQVLPWVEYAHNSLPSSTGLSSFQCCLGYQPPLFTAWEAEVAVPSVQVFAPCCQSMGQAQDHSSLEEQSRLMLNPSSGISPRSESCSPLLIFFQVLSLKLAPLFVGPFSISKVCNPSIQIVFAFCHKAHFNPVFLCLPFKVTGFQS